MMTPLIMPNSHQRCHCRLARREAGCIGAPVYLVSGVRVADRYVTGAPAFAADFLGAWRAYGELMGMPAEHMAGIVAQLSEQMLQPQVATAERIAELALEAGFTRIIPFCVFFEAIFGWIAR
jgi:hypothetical protein